MDRFLQLKQLLNSGDCFKMICGAGNEDALYVKKLALVYTLAGAKILDVSCNVKVIEHAMQGIDLAYEMSKELGIDIGARPFIMASIGMPGDHHVRKSYIDPTLCLGCRLCIPVCPTNAIPEGFISELEVWKELGGSYEQEDQSKEIVIKDLCIGCGKCSNICPKDDIISYRHNARELRELLPKCMEAGAETFELHAAVGEDDVTMEEWKVLNEINPHNYNSMCLDRLNLGNLKLEHRISEAALISNDRIIIQADGYPMSGGEDDYNTTLQAVACADVINKRFNIRRKKVKKETSGKAKTINKMFYQPLDSKKVIPIVLSGGTNSLSRELAEAAWVRCNGIAIGTFARDIVEDFVRDENFYSDVNTIKSAYDVAKSLVDKNKMTKEL
jgi:ferredoxin